MVKIKVNNKNVVIYNLWDLSRYEGELSDGKYHGQGILTWPETDALPGAKYVGKWKDGNMDGKGVLEFDEGVCYEGDFKNDLMHGIGVMQWPPGEKYIGEFKDDNFNGNGVLIGSSGVRYEGEFKDGEFHGHGTLTYPDELQGGWSDHNFKKQHIKYEGDFRNGEYFGNAIVTFRDGSIVNGKVKVTEFFGKSTVIFPNSVKYEFTWSGKKKKNEIITWPDGSKRKIYKNSMLSPSYKKENKVELEVVCGKNEKIIDYLESLPD